MADFTIPRSDIALHGNTLGAGVADKVDWASPVSYAEIITDGSDDVYVATDGSDAEVAGGKCYRIPAASMPVSRRLSVGRGGISIISASAVPYSVELA